MTYREYTDQDIVEAAKKVKSIAGLLRQLGLKPAGGNFAHAKKNLQRLNINTDHWTGRAWNKDEKLKDWKDYARATNLKKHLIRKKGHQCENCKLTEWLKKPITLEIEHIDGNRTNNSFKNLKLLCPNCHSYTKTWRRKKSSLKD